MPECWYLISAEECDDGRTYTEYVEIKAASRGKARAEAAWYFNDVFIMPMKIHKMTPEEIKEHGLDNAKDTAV